MGRWQVQDVKAPQGEKGWSCAYSWGAVSQGWDEKLEDRAVEVCPHGKGVEGEGFVQEGINVCAAQSMCAAGQ